MKENLLFELLQIAVGTRSTLSYLPSETDWKHVFKTAKKQSLIGLILSAIETLPQKQWPSLDVVNTFIGLSLKIESDNIKKTAQCVCVSKFFNDNGFSTCVLKGQGNIDNYPELLKKRRQSGDIDIWVWPNKSKYNVKKEVIEFCLSKLPADKCEEAYSNLRQHHVDFPYFDNIEVEVHFSPIYFNCPWTNGKWNKICEKAKSNELTESSNGFVVPSIKFNLVYQLAHIYRHLFTEGIGLRQLVDYYFLLKSFNELNNKSTLKDELIKELKSLNMLRFAKSIMWVLVHTFKMPEAYLICEADPITGTFVLEEILKSGNFGTYDRRYVEMKKASRSKRFFLITKRNMNFLVQYPSEVMFDPLLRFWNFLWRELRLWKVI